MSIKRCYSRYDSPNESSSFLSCVHRETVEEEWFCGLNFKSKVSKKSDGERRVEFDPGIRGVFFCAVDTSLLN